MTIQYATRAFRDEASADAVGPAQSDRPELRDGHELSDRPVQSAEPTATRRAVGVVRLVVGIFLLATIAIQIADRVVHNAFSPQEYFSYFTIQSSLINVVGFVAGGWMALRHRQDTVLYTIVRMSFLCYAVVTAGVYNLLLRGIHYVGYAGLQWPNEIMHVWVPIIIVLDWLLSPGRPALSWKSLRVVLLFPVAWLIYSLIRGAVSDYYPYPFLNPATAGWGSVIAYIVGLSAFILGMSALAIAYSRRARTGQVRSTRGLA